MFSEPRAQKHWKTNKNHEFLIFLHHSLKIMFFFWFLFVFPMFLNFLHRISWFLLVFSNVSELLVKKTLEKPIKNDEFLIFLHYSLKIMVFFCWFSYVSELFSMFLSFWLRKHWKNQ